MLHVTRTFCTRVCRAHGYALLYGLLHAYIRGYTHVRVPLPVLPVGYGSVTTHTVRATFAVHILRIHILYRSADPSHTTCRGCSVGVCRYCRCCARTRAALLRSSSRRCVLRRHALVPLHACDALRTHCYRGSHLRLPVTRCLRLDFTDSAHCGSPYVHRCTDHYARTLPAARHTVTALPPHCRYRTHLFGSLGYHYHIPCPAIVRYMIVHSGYLRFTTPHLVFTV